MSYETARLTGQPESKAPGDYLSAAFSICSRRNWRTIDLYLALGDAVIASFIASPGQFETKDGSVGHLSQFLDCRPNDGGASSLTPSRTSVSISERSTETTLRASSVALGLIGRLYFYSTSERFLRLKEREQEVSI